MCPLRVVKREEDVVPDTKVKISYKYRNHPSGDNAHPCAVQIRVLISSIVIHGLALELQGQACPEVRLLNSSPRH